MRKPSEVSARAAGLPCGKSSTALYKEARGTVRSALPQKRLYSYMLLRYGVL
jgi:hypothetical protein